MIDLDHVMTERRVLLVASEAVPFSKTGGLADVAGSLPGALKRRGCDVRVILPFYRVTRETGIPFEPCAEDVPVEIQGEVLPATLWRADMDGGIPCYFVGRDDLYDRSGLYGTNEGDFPDNALRFTYFSKAVFAVCRALAYAPDVLHCHDWQTALVPAYLRHVYGLSPLFRRTGSLLTIHNMAYQGVFPAGAFPVTGLPETFFSVGGMEFWGKANFLKAGIVTAGLLNTVSPSYSREILTEEMGCGMEGVLAGRESDLFGILNGADYKEWDPARDPHLPRPFGPDSLEGKHVCKVALLEELGLGAEREQEPLFGMITRLASQKGVDLLIEGLGDMMAMGANFILLGDGEERYRARLEGLAERFRGRFSFRYGFDPFLAHRIQGGIDFLLMPSRYEPCGLNQIYSMRYGTIPVGRATGGLKDTVEEFSSSTMEGTGFLFSTYDTSSMLTAVQKAVSVYPDRHLVDRLRRNGMARSFSWNRAAEAYLGLYDRLASRQFGAAEKASPM
jgi:starch synthase